MYVRVFVCVRLVTGKERRRRIGEGGERWGGGVQEVVAGRVRGR